MTKDADSGPTASLDSGLLPRGDILERAEQYYGNLALTAALLRELCDELRRTREVMKPWILGMSVADLGLTLRSSNALYEANILTVGQLAQRSLKEISALRMCGPTSCVEIQEAMSRFGIHLRAE